MSGDMISERWKKNKRILLVIKKWKWESGKAYFQMRGKNWHECVWGWVQVQYVIFDMGENNQNFALEN